jgi:miniconductance mechanosensitive channel
MHGFMTAETITHWLLQYKLSSAAAELLGLVTAVLYILTLALLANFAAKRLIQYVIHPIIRKTAIKWDDVLIQKNVIVRCSHIIPAAVIHLMAPSVFELAPRVAAFFQILVNGYLILIGLFVLDAALNCIRSLWERSSVGKRYPANSAIQAIKLLVNLIGVILILSVIMGKSPLVFFSGLGAATAILLLVFKDAILGLVAGIQLSLNNMVMMGDWIEMPDRGADGEVIDVSLTTVKIQNWNKTITTIPTYTLISESFKNWRGMSDSGGRRIKRALHLDMRSIQFADATLLQRFERMRLLRPYLSEKLSEIQLYNTNLGDDLSELINSRQLTNVGTFRAYCVAYLRSHPKIRQDMTLLVRQLAPAQNGLPIEIYVFCSDTAWSRYEDIQADLFDHLLSVIPEFKLQIFQAPSGNDLASLSHLTTQV